MTLRNCNMADWIIRMHS